MGRELRQHERMPFSANVMIDDRIMAKGIDISKGGLYVHTGRSFPSGRIVDVKFSLRGQEFTAKARIQHDQQAIGMGLEFLDLTDEQRGRIAATIEQLAAQRAASKTARKRVLLIEEDERLRTMNKSKLMLEGLAVTDVADGLDAARSLETLTPDLVVLDLDMKRMDGFKVLAVLRESPAWKDIPVIVYSAKGSSDVMSKVHDAGADEFLAKMMTSPAKLAHSVKSVLARRSAG